MRIAVLRETGADERRVALVPDSVGRLVRAGHQVQVEQGAGLGAGFRDESYSTQGATVCASATEATAQADVLAALALPPAETLATLAPGTAVIGFLDPAGGHAASLLKQHGLTGFAMELVPRTTKAQSMDALSSQATVAGYKAVLVGASALPRFLPMLTTAAGTITPAHVFIIGAGVAGLQAIATARRLGAVVSAFDVRPVVKEQVGSLGATFLEVSSVAAEGQGGYASELAADQQRRVAEAVAAHIKDMDLVITTAQIPGKPAPRIISAAMVRSMRAGSVIVDLAAETGGNCELTQAGKIVSEQEVSIFGPVNIAATLPYHASQMYSRNVQTFLEYVAKEGGFDGKLDDPIIGAMRIVKDGAAPGGRPDA
ncbi:MAG TPA: NAD(P) transhydrogenase subunit alpha [Gemmatimonadales bacterium]|jgi:NAD(P) transhydrogenase subunit alpha|nr:NAD(P) transhydrogenase subunit alpha [Gemmatimonadales bacterium]